ncbi:amidase [Pectobacterium sp. B2J-2]|uniref:amidase n=1 Tax=Pectobacterium sp. B2J-2 TaxID=3385372 RepID=UPI0038FD3DFF
MAIQRPSVEQLIELASSINIQLNPQQAAEYLSLMQGSFDAYDLIDALPDNIPVSEYPRTPGYRPTADENTHNAWYYKTHIPGVSQGKLAGKRVALKDNIALAGVPMMNGSATLEGYVPRFDATVVTRILDAGGTIVGKATCEHFCLSGGSHTSDPAPVHNPHRFECTSGGSSSGSATLVALGECDMAIGGDQGGSIRIPSAFCGTYGMKPTHGLVPYTGIMPIEATLDHTGPITANVKDNALLLEVLAGSDGLDPRQYAPEVAEYTAALNKGVKGLRIGLVTEGFALPNGDAQVSDAVRAAAARLEALGASVEEVSIPEHALGPAIWQPIGCEGLMAQMMTGNGMGFNWKGLYDVGLLDAHANWRQRAGDLSATLKICMLVGQYGIENYRGRFYAKAQNIARRLTAAYDAALGSYDVLVMPTVPMVAPTLPEQGAPLSEYIGKAFEMIANTAAFDITGHPAMSIPCGKVDQLPVGMMLIGKHFAESTIYQTAAALEAAMDWRNA